MKNFSIELKKDVAKTINYEKKKFVIYAKMNLVLIMKTMTLHSKNTLEYESTRSLSLHRQM